MSKTAGISEEEQDNVLPFRVITGGKPPSSDNWLLSIPEKSVFLARRKDNSRVDLIEYTVIKSFPEAVSLHFWDDHLHPCYMWADPTSFSKTYEFVKYLREGPEEEQ